MELTALQKAIQKVYRNQFKTGIEGSGWEMTVIDALEAISILEQLEIDLLAEFEENLYKIE